MTTILLERGASTTPDTLLRGRESEPAWLRPALLTLLAATGLLYVWDLGASGNANQFYAAAVQAGSESWKAWFFGSIDASNAITVDKPPAALWVMGLSARVFGYNSWSLLVPQALEGVAAVALLVAAVRRVAGPVAGLLAGAALALTPAAVLIFRFDNPDALLLLLIVAATYCLTRALEAARTRWLLLAGVAIGLGFLTKSGQALLVLPALSLAYLVAAPTPVRRRLVQLVLAGVAVVLSAGWWIAAVALWPVADRPSIGGSTDNSALELAFGYNGLGRLFGGSGNGGGGGGGGGTGFGGSTGLTRMFAGEFGLEISWLLPAALLGSGALAWLTRRRPRTDRLRAALIVWGGSLLVTGTVFSFMQGTIHPYYSVALAPSVAALVGIGGHALWQRSGVVAPAVLAAMLLATTGWSVVLLANNGASTLTVGVVTALGLLGLAALAIRATGARSARLVPALALAAVIAFAVPTASWGARTAATVHTGSIPTAVAGTTGDRGPGGGSGGPGSSGETTSAALTTALRSSTTRWAAATVGAQSAASLELSSDTAVMAIGGFTGSDSSPTLAQFKAYVAAGDIHYFVSGGNGGPGGGGGVGGSSGTSSQITAWVTATFTSTTIGGSTVYDLTSTF